MTYAILFLAILISNLIPVFVPPTWTIIVFAVNYDDLSIPLVILIAVVSATLGRLFLMQYIEWFSHKVFNRWEEDNLKFLGEKVGKGPKKDFLFFFLYSITPLPTNELFLAASLAKMPRFPIILGFFCGRSISYSILAYSSVYVLKDFEGLFSGNITVENVTTALVSLLTLFALIFLDWRALLSQKKLRLNFNIWRWSKV